MRFYRHIYINHQSSNIHFPYQFSPPIHIIIPTLLVVCAMTIRLCKLVDAQTLTNTTQHTFRFRWHTSHHSHNSYTWTQLYLHKISMSSVRQKSCLYVFLTMLFTGVKTFTYRHDTNGPLTIQNNSRSYGYRQLDNLEQYEATID